MRFTCLSSRLATRLGRLSALALALGAPAAAPAFLGLALGERQLVFFEPQAGEQPGEVDAVLDLEPPELELAELPGSALGSGYGASIHGVGGGVRARWDRYRFRGRLAPGRWKLGPTPLAFGFGVAAGAELRFLRHFPDAAAAAAAAPVPPGAIRSLDALLAVLGPGDMASLPVQAALLLQASADAAVAGIPVRPSLFLKLSGAFQANVLRLRGQRVRVRLLSLASRTVGGAIKAGFLWDAELMELLGSELRVVSELTLLKASLHRQRGQGMLFDATLDLADPRARQAFEWLFYRPVTLDPSRGAALSPGWALVQELAAAAEASDAGPGAVTLHHCGLLDYRQDAFNLKLGNALLRWGRRDLTTVLEFRPQEAGADPLVLAASMSTGKGSAWFGARETKWLWESQVYARRQPQGLELALWSMRYRIKDRRFSRRDRDDLAEKLAFQLGPGHGLDLPPPADPPPRVKAEIVVRLARPALEAVAAAGERGIEAALRAYVATLDLGPLWLSGSAGDLARLPRDLYRTLTRALTRPDPRALEELARLRVRNLAFQELGSGFLLHLLGNRADDPRWLSRAVFKDYRGGKHKTARGRLESEPAEAVLPVLRFLETGVTDLQEEAAEEALEARASR